jgi:hypothetical protein
VPYRGTAVLCPSSRRLSPVPAGEVQRVPPPHNPFVTGFPGGAPHAHHLKKAKGALHISRGGLEGLLPLQKTPSSALSLPCEIVSISQGRPLLAPEFTTSGQEEAGKGLTIPVWGGSSLHATPFRQEAAVHWMPMGRPHPASPAPRGRGPSRPPHSPESFCMTNHPCTQSRSTSARNSVVATGSAPTFSWHNRKVVISTTPRPQRTRAISATGL